MLMSERSRYNHYKVEIEGLDVHFIHHRSERADAIPLILCHGWPGQLLSSPTPPPSPFSSHAARTPSPSPFSALANPPSALTGSFDEFLSLIAPLTSPEDPSSPAFHVIIPSMPGFTFSSPPSTSHWTMDDTARVFDKLMQGLGYEKYAAQGGDWGSITARCLGALFPERCLGASLPRSFSRAR